MGFCNITTRQITKSQQRNLCAGNTDYTQIYHYDADGNFTYKREGPSIFNYIYKANTNILDTLITGSNHYAFTYDTEGRLHSDPVTEVYNILYNYQNLPILYGNVLDRSYYYYDEAGNRIGKKIFAGANEFCLRDHMGKELLYMIRILID